MKNIRTSFTQINRPTTQENTSPIGSLLKPLLLVLSASLLILSMGCSNSAEASHPASSTEPNPSVESSPDPETTATAPTRQPTANSTPQPTAQPSGQPGSEPDQGNPNAAKDTNEAGDIAEGKGITAIGDSVILDAAPYLDKLLPGIVVDGKVGRQMTEAQDTINSLAEDGKLGDLVIIELGTNGSFNKKVLRSLLDSLKDVDQIFLVNTRVPRQWQDTVNSDLTKVAEEFSNASVIDWYSASKGKDDFFSKDGVHLNREGAEFYADLLAQSIQGEGA
ncbi:hypothetical protein [Paenibacillus sp. HB172176]|uniref:SGNH/GDSL hydrolase family protein n=1 Tax=Paenibacillus sp. HB172176 TaxID=2493690 RepID=UPI001439E1EA|nr:hypothetical protein [Paenibacillus sp. HB172176]